MAPRDSISDDWEDVADDNLSVISLPASEPETPSGKEDPGKRRASSASSLSISSSLETTQQELESTHKDVSVKGKEVEDRTKQELDHNPDSPGPAAWHDAPSEALEDPFKDPEADTIAEEADDESDAVKELLDDASHEVDPVYLSKTVTSLRQVLQDTFQTIRDLDALDSELTQPSLRLCEEIQHQVDRLQPMLSSYSKVSDTSELPIDPALHSWLTGVRVKAIALRAESQRLARDQSDLHENNHDYRTLWQYADIHVRASELIKTWDKLGEYKKQMDDFLPIMLAYVVPSGIHAEPANNPGSDFDEYQTKNLPVATPFIPTEPINIPVRPSYRRKSGPSVTSTPTIGNPTSNANVDIWNTPQPAPPPPSYGGSPRAPAAPTAFPVPVPGTNPDGPSNTVWLLRRDLYHLKDLLLRAQERLTTSVSTLDAGLAEWAVTAAIRYTKLAQAVGNAVSNHASDWYVPSLRFEHHVHRHRIESTSSGGMTYPEFVALDRDLIGIYTVQLEEVVGKPKEPHMYGGRRGFLPVREPVLDADGLEILERLGDLLSGMFRVPEDRY
ncbi:hypothetical protein OQA88_8079 [Cercophora sp. LCS_1]